MFLRCKDIFNVKLCEQPLRNYVKVGVAGYMMIYAKKKKYATEVLARYGTGGLTIGIGVQEFIQTQVEF